MLDDTQAASQYRQFTGVCVCECVYCTPLTPPNPLHFGVQHCVGVCVCAWVLGGVFLLFPVDTLCHQQPSTVAVLCAMR